MQRKHLANFPTATRDTKWARSRRTLSSLVAGRGSRSIYINRLWGPLTLFCKRLHPPPRGGLGSRLLFLTRSLGRGLLGGPHSGLIKQIRGRPLGVCLDRQLTGARRSLLDDLAFFELFPCPNFLLRLGGGLGALLLLLRGPCRISSASPSRRSRPAKKFLQQSLTRRPRFPL